MTLRNTRVRQSSKLAQGFRFTQKFDLDLGLGSASLKGSGKGFQWVLAPTWTVILLCFFTGCVPISQTGMLPSFLRGPAASNNANEDKFGDEVVLVDRTRPSNQNDAPLESSSQASGDNGLSQQLLSEMLAKTGDPMLQQLTGSQLSERGSLENGTATPNLNDLAMAKAKDLISASSVQARAGFQTNINPTDSRQTDLSIGGSARQLSGIAEQSSILQLPHGDRHHATTPSLNQQDQFLGTTASSSSGGSLQNITIEVTDSSASVAQPQFTNATASGANIENRLRTDRSDATAIENRLAASTANRFPSASVSRNAQSSDQQIRDADRMLEQERRDAIELQSLQQQAQVMQQSLATLTQSANQSFGRTTGNFSNANNQDPSSGSALANLLLDQVNQSVAHQMTEKAGTNTAEIPAFDLNGNRPLRNTASSQAPTHTSPEELQGDVLPGQWKTEITSAIDSLERTIHKTQETTEKQTLEIYLRLLRLIASDHDAAVRTIESLPPQMQSFWREQLFALTQITKQTDHEQDALFINNSRRASKALSHLQNAVTSLQSEATLKLQQVHFCSEIRSYGDYDLATSTMLKPNDPILIYCEVENYSTQKLTGPRGDRFQTRLVPSYTIFNDAHVKVSEKVYTMVEDQCRSHRQDFYLLLPITVPTLPPGKYHLQITIEDVEGRKVAVSGPLTFQVRN